MKSLKGRSIYIILFSVFTRFSVLLFLVLLALWTEYLNLKYGYNNARLVELSSGKMMRYFYEATESLFSVFGDPFTSVQKNAGMPWSFRIMGLNVTDPICFLSMAVKGNVFISSFLLGLLVPLALVLLFNRAFCSYICPASLLFYCVARVRRMLGKILLLPDVKIEGGAAWGVLGAGLIIAYLFTHGIWAMILPYFAVGQTVFQGIALGTISITIWSVVFFMVADLIFGEYFVCRNFCPTGKLLSVLGQKSLFRIKKDESKCLASSCDSCNAICPFQAKPKFELNYGCSMCGECVAVCPTSCLKIEPIFKGKKSE